MAGILLGGRARRRATTGGPAPTGTDEFTGPTLSSFWTEIDPLNAETISFSGGALQLAHSGTTYTDLNATTNTAFRLVQPWVGDFDVTFASTRVLTNDFEAFGFYVDNGAHAGDFQAMFAFRDSESLKAWYPRRIGGVASEDSWPYPTADTGWARYQRATLVGGTLTWWHSPTGDDGSWTFIYSIGWSGGAGQRIGFMRGANQAAEFGVEYFRIAGSGGGTNPDTPGGPGTIPVENPTPTIGKPSVPTSVTGGAGGGTGRARISWQPPTSDGGSPVTSYIVQRDGTSLDGYGQWTDTVDANTRDYEFWNLRGGDTYPMRVAAINAQGQGPWASVSLTVLIDGTPEPDPDPTPADPTPIVPPTTCTLTAVGGGFTADWNDVSAPANNFGRYEYRNGGSNPPTGLPTSTGFASDATVSVPTTTAQYIQIRAVNNAGVPGAWSQVFGPVTPLAGPPPPPPGSRNPVLHPFSSDSPWNLPVADSAVYEATGGPLTTRMRESQYWAEVSTWGPTINLRNYSHPVNVANSGSPVATVVDVDHGFTVQYRNPSNAYIASGDDAHMHTIDLVDGKLHETWATSRTGTNTYNTHRYEVGNVYSKGIGPQAGTRAYGGSALAGLIRQWEVDQANPNFVDSGLRVGGRAVPRIQHALAIALANNALKNHDGQFGYDGAGYGTNRDGYVWPATETDWNGPSAYFGTIPMGAYFVLDRAVNVMSLGLSWSGTAMALAAQDYGVYVTDHSGCVAFYLEISSSVPANVDQFGNDAWQHIPTILRNLRAVTNNGANTPNGGALGSARRRPLAPNLA